MLRIYHRISPVLLALILPFFSTAAEAQANVVANPGFASDFAEWETFAGRTAEWFPLDSKASPDSGSALIIHSETSDGVVPLVLFQCIEVSAQEDIEFGGDVVVPSGQPEGTAAFIFFEQFVNDRCFGTPYGFHSVSSAITGQWSTISDSIFTPSNVQSVRLSIGTFKPGGETGNASSIFDNLFVNAPVDNVINPSMSASWFDPAQSGHGIMLHLLNDTDAWMCWFTFNNANDPVWICSLGTIAGDTITFEDAFTAEGGAFPPNFDPNQIVEVPWGTIVVDFTACNEGTMTWTTNAAGFQSGSMPLTRLTSLWGASCP